MVETIDGRCAWPPVPSDSHTGTISRPLECRIPWPGPVAITFQSYSSRKRSNVSVISTGSENVSPSSSVRM